MANKLRVAIASPHVRHDALEVMLRDRLGLDVLRVREQSELDLSRLNAFMPNYVFFPHWSWKIPAEIYEGFECVIFHMTDLPFGRGGSPLQNLVARGIIETKLTALRCVAELDAGPVYMKRPISLLGTAEEILMRASQLTGEMIEVIVQERPVPQLQTGESTTFRRRTAQDGNLASLETLDKVFDFIRMLDGDGYPPAFLETEHFKLEFGRASLRPNCVIADVKIIRKKP
jgi:methionyl-tRNA formyltransferase